MIGCQKPILISHLSNAGKYQTDVWKDELQQVSLVLQYVLQPVSTNQVPERQPTKGHFSQDSETRWTNKNKLQPFLILNWLGEWEKKRILDKKRCQMDMSSVLLK